MTASQRAALRELAHQVLCAETGATAVTRLCQRCGSSTHGRPLALVQSGAAPAVSISYAGDLVAVAWGWAGAVGIDIDHSGPPVDGVDRQTWTRMEALLKAGGGDRQITTIEVPEGYLGTVAGDQVSWRLAGPAAPPA